MVHPKNIHCNPEFRERTDCIFIIFNNFLHVLPVVYVVFTAMRQNHFRCDPSLFSRLNSKTVQIYQFRLKMSDTMCLSNMSGVWIKSSCETTCHGTFTKLFIAAVLSLMISTALRKLLWMRRGCAQPLLVFVSVTQQDEKICIKNWYQYNLTACM